MAPERRLRTASAHQKSTPATRRGGAARPLGPASPFRVGSAERRLRVMLVLAALVFTAILGRVLAIQTVQADRYRAAGAAQRQSTVTLRADRGTIFDRSGTELAVSVPAKSIYADTRLVTDPTGTARVLAQVLRLSPDKESELADAFAAHEKSFVYVARLLDDATADSVLALDLAGIDAVREPARIRAAGDLGLGVIGRTDPFGEGATGLEKQYDGILTGQDGQLLRELDSSGRTLPGASRVLTTARPGTDLVLSLDRSIQYQVEQLLMERVEELAAKGGHAVVMDTKTGELLAVSSVERGEDGTVRTTTGNLAAVEASEPGSVAKVFSVAAALDQGAVTPDTDFEVPGEVVFDEGTQYEHTIKDAYPHELADMTVRQILVQSSNIGTLMTAATIDKEVLGDYLTRFGFGSTTGLGFPQESGGILKPPSQWYGTESATISYGYGFAATAVQLVAAVNAVANGGTYVAPKMLLGTIDGSGVFNAAGPSATHEVLKPETAATMRQLLTDVVCSGTGTLAQIDGMPVAGKTGTGYKLQDNGTYEGDDGERAYFATFVGFLPADNPDVTILVSIDEPDPTSRDRFGGTAAAPVFADIAQVVIHERSVEPGPGPSACPGG